jgi:hypothetical protein
MATNKIFICRGSAEIGYYTAFAPFAKLFVTNNTLNIKTLGTGTLTFTPEDIIAIEPATQLQLKGSINIIHRRLDYNKHIEFKKGSNADALMEAIKNTGFMDTINSTITPEDEKILVQQQENKIAFKHGFAYVCVTLAAFFLVYHFTHIKSNVEKEPLLYFILRTFLWFILIFITTTLLLISNSFRRLVLKKDVSLNNIKALVRLILIIHILLGCLLLYRFFFADANNYLFS